MDTHGSPRFRADSFTPDWVRASARARTAGWAGDILQSLRADFAFWRQRLVIPGPETPSDWTHHYFCGRDGAPLRFDPLQPHRHACPKCDQIYTGEPWDGAWRTQMHNAAAAQLERASVLMRTGDPAEAADARAELLRIVLHYADRYADYAPHGKNAGTGRVQPQGLDEAVWAITLFRSLRWSGVAREAPELRGRIDPLARSVIDLLRPQVGQIHNIHCWLLGALAACASWLGDDDLLGWCRDHPFGAEAQVLKGFYPEGLWYEVNPHYHYYTVAALLSYLEAAGPAGLSDAASRRLALAINQPPLLAYADGRLPAYADGWPDCFVHHFAALAEAARAFFPGARIDLPAYYVTEPPAPLRLWHGGKVPAAGSPPLVHRASVAAFVFGADEIAPPPVAARTGPFVWPHAGIGLLRNEQVRLALRFGPDGGWHDHRDKLNVDVETAGGWQSLDLGTSGYGSAFTEWMRSPVAHNLVVFDGQMQPAHTGRLVESTDRHLVAESTWEGAHLRRSLQLATNGWTDTCAVALASPRRIDWCFHGDGVFTCDHGEAVPDEIEGDGGYRGLKNVRLLPASALPGGVLSGAWRAVARPSVALSLPIPAGFAVYLAEGDGNPNGRPLGFVILRATEKHAVFAATFTPLA